MLRIDCGPSRNHYLLLEWTRELAFLKRPLAHPATVKIKLSITKHQLQANTQGYQRQDSISNQSLFRSYPPVWIAKRQRHGVPQSETNDPTSEREPL